jgi:hypothetical protein
MLNKEALIPFTNGKYKVTVFGQLFFKDRLVSVVDSKCVELIINHKTHMLPLATLMVVAFFKINLLPKYWKRIHPIFKDNDESNLNLTNLSYGFNGDPVESDLYKGFYHIPFFTSYFINKTGGLINGNGQIISWFITPYQEKKNITGGYYTAGIHNDLNKRTWVSRHRLLSLTFKKYSSDPKKLVTNHKDGIPGNDWLDNLELVTYAVNNQHAYDNGLRPNGTVPVLYKNYITGKEKSFISIQKCADYLNLTHSAVYTRITRDKDKVFEDGHMFKYDDGTPWIELPKTISKNRIRSIAVVARNIFTGDIFIFDSIRQAAAVTNVAIDTIDKQLQINSHIAYLGFNFRSLQDNIDWPEHNKFQLAIYKDYPTKSPNGVIIKDINTGEETFFTSAEKAALEFNCSPIIIRTRCFNNSVINGKKYCSYKLTESYGPLTQ